MSSIPITAAADETPPKKKVALLGGGPGGLAAAYYLTSTAGWSDRYEITIYQEKHLLGGKCASGRDPEAPWRIDEHGLHLLLGFYDETFRLLDAVYTELGLDVDEAFEGVDRIHLIEKVDDRWAIAPLVFKKPPKIHDLARTPETHDLVDPAKAFVDFIVDNIEEYKADGFRIAWDALGVSEPITMDQVAPILAHHGDPHYLAYPKLAQGLLARGLDERSEPAYRDLLQRFQRGSDEPARGTEAWHRHVVLLLALKVGLFFAGKTTNLGSPKPEDFEGLDFRAWLQTVHTPADAIDSAVLSAAYNLVFCRAGELSATSAIHGALRMIQKSYYYRPLASIAETVIAQLYLVLRKRGVRFEFFHRVVDVELEGGRVSAIELQREANCPGEYDPLLPHLRGDARWRRSFPRESPVPLIADGPRFRLRVDREFDYVVLAIPAGALHLSCPSLLRSHEGLREAAEHLGTTATRSAQVYLSRPLDASAGTWKPQGGVLSSCPAPFETFADMSASLPASEGTPPGVVYLCGLGGDGEHARDVEREAREWIERLPRDLWPRGAPHHGIVEIAGRANVKPSERYVQCRPGTAKYRIDPGGTGIANLSLAGDWTTSALNAGCVEAAVTSGKAAAASVERQYEAQRVTLRARFQAAAKVLEPYVTVDGDATERGPFRYDDAKLYSFFVKGDLGKLQGLCDTFLNLAPSTDQSAGYRAIGPVLAVQAVYSPKATSMAANAFPGYLVSHAMAITVPVALCDYDPATGHTPKKLFLFSPYIFVDTAIEMAAGRETYGVFKLPGQFTANAPGPTQPVVTDWKTARSFHAQTMAVPAGGGLLDWRPALDVSCTGDGAVKPHTNDGDDLSVVMTALVETLGGQGLVLDELMNNGFTNAVATSVNGDGAFGLVGLKQFRDHVDTTQAVYREVVQIPLTWGGLPTGAVLQESQYKVRLPADYANIKIASSLNLPAGADIPVVGAYCMYFSPYILGKTP